MDLRERIVAARAAGQTAPSVATQFQVSTSSVRLYCRRARQGKLAPIPLPGHKPRLLPAQEADFIAMVREHPDFTLAQFSEEWQRLSGVSLPKSTLWDHLKRLGGRFKKRVWSPQNAVSESARSFAAR